MKRRFRDVERSRGGHNLSESSYVRKVGYLFLGLLAFVVGCSIYLFVQSRDLPSLQQLEEYKPKLASKVYSADLKIIDEYFVEKRSYVALEDMPVDLINAVIATEDRKFFSHWGFDLRRFVQAAFINLISMDFSQGASTLTQQLARQIYIKTIGLEKTITRKVKELITAIQIERTYTKEEILEMYLNHVNFGHGAYGCQSGARKYYGKDVQELTVDECAMLVGLLKAPGAYTPFRHPERALRRRNIVLAAMRDMDFITEDEFETYLNKPIEVVDRREEHTAGLAPYFVEYVRKKMQEQYGYDLYTEGLSIYTTLDSRAQACAEKAVNKQIAALQQQVNDFYIKKGLLRELADSTFWQAHDFDVMVRDSAFVDSLLKAKVRAQAALVSIDPRNGHILAMVGGRDFSESKWNRAVQARRQPGSAFKPFVYTVAVDNGFPPSYEVLNQPVVTFMPDGSRWSPRNYDHTVGGPTTFREGLRRSLNLVTIRVLQNVIKKPELVVDYAHRLGIKSHLDAVSAIALGVSDVTPLEITSAYGVFANRGVLVEPVAILRVEDKNGSVIFQHIPKSREVLRKETAYIITNMLQTVMDHGTGGSARWRYHFYRPAAGKTGTTQDYSDAWFLGFTPQIVTGVWTGLDDYTRTLGDKQTGTRAALPIWAPYMKAVHDTLGLPEADFVMPEGVVKVTICKDSKLLTTPDCPCETVEEVFFKELAPTKYCDEGTNVPRRKKRSKEKRRRF